MRKRKYMNQWVVLQFNDWTTRAKIVGIEFHQGLQKPVFDLVSSKGNPFKLTREELAEHEVGRVAEHI
jgi:hypothetical protein